MAPVIVNFMLECQAFFSLSLFVIAFVDLDGD